MKRTAAESLSEEEEEEEEAMDSGGDEENITNESIMVENWSWTLQLKHNRGQDLDKQQLLCRFMYFVSVNMDRQHLQTC